MKELDCLGQICPVPYLLFKKELDNIHEGESLFVLIDHSCAKEKIESYCLQNRLSFSTVEPINGVWEITINK